MRLLQFIYRLGTINEVQEISPVRAALVYAFEPVWAAVISLGLGLEGDPTFWLFIGAGSLYWVT